MRDAIKSLWEVSTIGKAPHKCNSTWHYTVKAAEVAERVFTYSPSSIFIQDGLGFKPVGL